MYPIEEALPALKAALATRNSTVLVAPPGAGKTTVAPLALLAEPWASGGKVVLLEPRRLAARAAAERMAASLNEAVGGVVGYRMRLDTRVSARTRLEVVTEGVFTRMILEDPALEGVAAVLFDEFHERSLDADLGLAFARDAQRHLRPDLKLLVMSATLDPAPVAKLLDEAPIIESLGRAFPVETRYLGREPGAAIEDQAVRAVLRALADDAGGILVFLPGQAEIVRTAEMLGERLAGRDVVVAPLYGALDRAAQDRAIAPATPPTRKVVIATSIAQTSLTLDGIGVVIDSGLARAPRYDPASGITRLGTERVSRAAADQRRGRAGRTGPGVCYRLWDERETRGLAPFDRPEIRSADLASVALDLALWGARDPSDLAFLDPPPAAAMAEARVLLEELGALDLAGAVTAHGRRIAQVGLPPRLAHMVARAAASGEALRAAEIAALIVERGLGGRAVDIELRLEAFSRDRSRRAADARRLAARWASAAGSEGKAPKMGDALLLAEAYPERVAQARGQPGQFRLANGRGAHVAPDESLARASWLAVAELGGRAVQDRIRLAAELDPDALATRFSDRVSVETRVEIEADGRVRARQLTLFGALALKTNDATELDPGVIAQALIAEVLRRGLDQLPWTEGARRLRARAAFLRAQGMEAPDLSDAALLDRPEAWLAPALEGAARLSDVDAGRLEAALRGLAPFEAHRALDRLAPERYEAPTGSRLPIDYAAGGGPRVDVRVQEVFGLSRHPTVAGGSVPLTLALLSPAGRPIQLTRDLPGFWRGGWAEVRKEMRGRYPKHPWPEDPAAAPPTARAIPRRR